MKANKMDQPNQGVICEVNSCQYYMSGNHCTADKIEVTPKDAKNSDQTDCSTFIPQAKF